jgi:hypothetical protein
VSKVLIGFFQNKKIIMELRNDLDERYEIGNGRTIERKDENIFD